MRAAKPLRRLAGDCRGVSLVEFGLVAPVLAMTIIGLFDMGYSMYVHSVLQGALHDAARMATVGNITGEQIDAKIKSRLDTVSNHGTVTLKLESYTNFSDVKMPEKITGDTVPIGQYNVGDCYEDANGNGRYDLDRGKTGLGRADDIVNYTVTITYDRVLPVAGLFGWSDTNTITGSTPLRNQPYAARALGTPIRCS